MKKKIVEESQKEKLGKAKSDRKLRPVQYNFYSVFFIFFFVWWIVVAEQAEKRFVGNFCDLRHWVEWDRLKKN
jgi:hypothetical protein